ncbi:MAG: AAA family ATPase [Anaerolineae bacterium]
MNVMHNICAWVATRPYWEQLTFEAVVLRTPPGDATLVDILDHLLYENDLGPKPASRQPLTYQDVPAEERVAPRDLRLRSIQDLQNVNALAGSQTLNFCDHLTAVYGKNGSGKSGYARVLGCAGFTRGDTRVLGNVMDNSSSGSPTARIVIETPSGTETIDYCTDDRCAELSSVHVFDTTSVTVHLTRRNTLSFSPAGLERLTLLAEYTDRVRARLDTLIEAKDRPLDQLRLFADSTPVLEALQSLKDTQGLSRVEELASLTDKELAWADALELEIALLKNANLSEERARLVQQRDDLLRLASWVQSTSGAISEAVEAMVGEVVGEVRERTALAQRFGVERFRVDGLRTVGSPEWRAFAQAARSLGKAEASASGQDYPCDGDVCLLCNQHLEPEAVASIWALWGYLVGDFEAGLRAALDRKTELEGKLREPVPDFSTELATYRLLEGQAPGVVEYLRSWFWDARGRLRALQDRLGTPESDSAVPRFRAADLSGIGVLIADYEAKISELAVRNPEEEIKERQRELLMLSQRKLLAENIDAIRNWAHGREWAARARRARGSTAHITRKHNELFDELVTKRYVQLFQDRLDELGRPLLVHIMTEGRKGTATKQLIVAAAERTAAGEVELDQVLSEGEKRIVALTDFLTENDIDTSGNVMVLDDPMTSLDLEWRELVARLLVLEARDRQVVVFTHDLPFLSYLKSESDSADVQAHFHWIQRRGSVPGYIYLDNSPVLEKDYRTSSRPKSYLQAARGCGGEQQDHRLRDGYAALRTCYEVLVIRDMFGEVVKRFEERVSMERLKDVHWDAEVASRLRAEYGRISRMIEAHSHSDALGESMPSVEDLEASIKRYDDIKTGLKALSNAK